MFIPPTIRPSKNPKNKGELVGYQALSKLLLSPDKDESGGALRDYITEALAKKRGSKGRGKRGGRTELDDLKAICLAAKRGEQHDALLALIDESARSTDNDEMVLGYAWGVAQQMTNFDRSNPWREGDIRGLLHRPGRRPIADANAEEAEDLKGIQPEYAVRPADEDEERFWESRKELRLIREWARARRAGPWAVLGEVLAAVVCRTPPNVVLPPLTGGYGTLNMLIALTGKSGAGKGTSGSVARDAVAYSGDSIMASPARVPLGSGEGLAKTFGYSHKGESGGIELVRTAYTAIVTVTEIDNFAALGARNASTLSPQLRQLYSGEEIGFGYSGADKRVIIPAHSYRACVVAGVQPGRGEVILGDTDSGFAQRWLWFRLGDPQAPDSPPTEPDQIGWALPASMAEMDEDSKQLVMPVAQVAVDEIDAARLARLRGHGEDEIAAHSHYTRLKVAAALGLLAGRDRVTAEDWELSAVLMRVSDATRDATAALLREKAAEANRERGRAEGIRSVVAAETSSKLALERVGQNVLKKTRREWTSASDIRRQMPQRDREMLDDVLAYLVDNGKLEHQAIKNRNGQIGNQYRKASK